MDCALGACNDTINAFHTPSKQWNAYTVSSMHYMLVNQFFRDYNSGHKLLTLKHSHTQDQKHKHYQSATTQQTIQEHKNWAHQSLQPQETHLKMPPKPPPAPVCPFCGSFMCMYQAQGKALHEYRISAALYRFYEMMRSDATWQWLFWCHETTRISTDHARLLDTRRPDSTLLEALDPR